MFGGTEMKKLFVPLVVLSIVFIHAKISHSSHYWTKTYGGSGSDQTWDIMQTTDGEYIVTGSTNSFGAGDRDHLRGQPRLLMPVHERLHG